MTIKESYPYLSIVIPVLNEEDCIFAVLEELWVLWKRGGLPQDLEVIVVDDGSWDATNEAVLTARTQFSPFCIRSLKHHRSFGQTQALSVGFRSSSGHVVVALDGDGQNDPADIPALVKKLEDLDIDCVSGWRRERRGDKGIRLAFSRVANGLLIRASGIKIHDSGCTLKAYRGETIRQIPLYGDMHRIIPFQIEMFGGQVDELTVNHRARFGGESKYSISRTVRVAQDIIVTFFLKRFVLRPMHLLGTLGSAVLGSGFVGFLVSAGLKVFGVYDFVETPLLLVSLVLIIGGLNIMGIGIVAEMLNRQANFRNPQLRPFGWVEQ